MAEYFTEAQLTARIPAATWAAVGDSDAQAAALAALQAHAQGEIDGGCAGRYDVPFDDQPNTPIAVQEVALQFGFSWLILGSFVRANEPQRKSAELMRRDARSTVKAWADPNDPRTPSVPSSEIAARFKTDDAEQPRRHTLGNDDFEGTDDGYLYGEHDEDLD